MQVASGFLLCGTQVFSEKTWVLAKKQSFRRGGKQMRNKWIVLVTLTTAAWLVTLSAAQVVAAPIRQAQPVPFSDPAEATQAAVEWLVATHQNDDGGFTSFSTGADLAPSDVGGAVDAALALAAAGQAMDTRFAGQERSLLDYMDSDPAGVAAYAAQDGATAGKLVMALAAGGQNPRNFGGHNFVISLTQHLSPTGQLGVNTAFNQSLAILGLAAVSEPIPPSALDWLSGLQADNGSWDDGFGTADNPDATAMAIMALVSSDRPADDPVLIEATSFLVTAQLPGGGWEYGPGFGANANSTALVVQAFSALGRDVASPDSEGRAPMTSLLAWQSSTGAFQADFGSGRFDDFFTTVQAIPAVAGRPYPLNNPAAAAGEEVPWLAAVILLAATAGLAIWSFRKRS